MAAFSKKRNYDRSKECHGLTIGYNTARPPGDDITKIVTNLGGNKLTAQEAGASPRLVFLR